MTKVTVMDSVDKKLVDPRAMVEYSREIAPKIKDLLYQKELQKDFKESDDTAVDLAEAVKTAQAQLKDYLKKDDDYKAIQEKVDELEKEIKEAIKSMSKVCEFKPADLKAFLQARVKDVMSKKEQKGTVVKTVDKGQTFDQLNHLLDGI